MKNNTQTAEALHTDKEGEARSKAGSELFTEQLRQFKQKFDNLCPGVIKSIEDLQAAMYTPKQFFERFILNQIPDFEMGLAVNKQERLKSLQFPDFSELVEISNTMRLLCRQYDLPGVESIYTLNGDSVEVDSKAFSKYLERHTIQVAEANADKLEFIRLQKDLAKSFEAFRDFCGATFGENNTKNVFDFRNGAMSGFDLNVILSESGNTVDINLNLYKRFFDYFYKK